MSSLLLGNPATIQGVYPPQTRRLLQEQAGLHPDIVDAQTLAHVTTPFADVRALFGTWSFPALNEADIARLFPRLEAVFYAAGSVQYFARPFLSRGVRVFSAWGANGVPVAEFAASEILLANKGFFPRARLFSRGGREALKTLSVDFPGNYGCAVGIIGAGMIGKLVIEILRRHDLKLFVYDPFLPPEEAEALGVTLVPLETLFDSCQTISNHLANNAQTKGMLNYALFSRMRPGATFLNTGRGAQVVEADLCRLLTERPDVTAVLDVTEPEPPREGDPLYTLPNAVLTPHIAGSIGQEVERLSAYMAQEYLRFSAGEPCRWEVTPQMLATMA